MNARFKMMSGKDIIPVNVSNRGFSYRKIIERFSRTCFEARNLAEGARLFERMIDDGDTIWLGISGAGVVGGLGGYIIELIKRGFIDVICSTGAQVYHDLHFAYGFPVKQGCPRADDNKLRELGVTRIYDTYISESETLIAQDKIIRQFGLTCKLKGEFSSADFNYALGNFVRDTSKFPKFSFVAAAAKYGVPIFFDSNSNHSIGMNLAGLYLDGRKIEISSNLDVLESAAIAYRSKSNGFFELGGGGPKNFIQQTGPTISQILGIDFKGADRGLQITTALERDGGLSGCTFQEGVTWGKYKDAAKDLVQIFGEYSTSIDLMVGYVLESCKNRNHKRIFDKKTAMLKRLKMDRKS